MWLVSLLLFFLLLCPPSVAAIYNPLSVPNNRFGIHIVDTNDLADLPTLVNSTGGDWGYVTMVLSDSERDHSRWQIIFDKMRRTHLIPIVRLATHVENGTWVKPTKDRLYEIVNLLNGLNWPTENRYVILYNEPNHANEWGNTLAPEDYAETFVTLAQSLKAVNKDFFILPAGLDASAADDGIAMDEAEYLRRMIAAKPEILSLIDGWNSHSYPNPGFSGSPYASGRGTLHTYEWEMNFLRGMGLTRDLPIFITETGWVHSEGRVYAPNLLSTDQVATNVQIAATTIWNDPHIAAVTPFLYSYQDVPFDHFSWRKLGNSEFYSPYYAYQALSKIKGAPKQRESYILTQDLLPKKLIANSTYTLSAEIENDGQGILNPKDGYEFVVTEPKGTISTFTDPIPTLEPGEKGHITIHLKTPKQAGTLLVTAKLIHNKEAMILEEKNMDFVPPPSVEVRAHLGWRKTSDANDVTILIYDDKTLLQKFTGLTMQKGKVTANGLVNIIPGTPYRVVTLVRGYLPRQVIGALNATRTTLYPNRFLPLDFNGDGTFTLSDVQTVIQVAPLTALARFFGP